MHRLFIALFCTVLLFRMSSFAQQKNNSTQKWNIVLFIADDLGVNDIQPYGNKIVQTPNLVGLANESVLFNHVFASSPTCAPSRSSLLTGLMPYRHGGHGNHAAVKENTRSLVHYLKPLQYKVAIAGKLHVGPEASFPFERIEHTNIPEPGYEKHPGLNYDLQLDPVDKWLGEQTKDQPFCLIVADHSPHVIWPEKTGYNPSQIDIPAKHIDTKETRASRARYYADISKMDNNLGKLLNSLEQRGFSENTLIVFTADQGPQWPFAKWSLYDDGIKVPLLVRWPGKVKKARSSDALVSLTDLVPTFVELAGGIAPAGIDGMSFLKVLNGQTDRHRDMVFASHTGDGQMNRSPARMAQNHRYKYILNIAPEIPYTTHMDRANDHDGGREYWNSWRAASFANEKAAATLWRYHNRPREELYDVAADPAELKNLAEDSSLHHVVETFRARLAAWRQTQNDTAAGPEEIKPAPAAPRSQKPLVPYIF